jgi:two-component system phosphate regulon sensor histidine kinase PhoR
MLILSTILLSAAVVALLCLIFSLLRRQKDLSEALRKRTPYLLAESSALLPRQWRETASAANDLIYALHAAELARSGQVTQLEATLGSLQEGVIGVDESNQIILANKAVATIFPRTQVIIGQRIETIAHSSAFSAFLDDVRLGVATTRLDLDFAVDGGSIWVEATGSVVNSWDGSRSRWVLCVFHDITRLKRLENLRKEFVANVSHELRTPLSVIKGFLETLVDGHSTIPESDRERFLRTIQRHTDRLHIILEDLLTLSRLESRNPGLAYESVNLVWLLRELAEDYRQRATASGHRIELRIPAGIAPISADQLRLRQVFDNLLDNALKYTPTNSSICIEIGTTSHEVEVRVVDTGPGIPAKDLPHIFERFYRVDKGRSRETGGTGLGLSIVKHIVQLHGGRVWAESAPGHGTAIIFVLPIQQLAPQPGPTARALAVG